MDGPQNQSRDDNFTRGCGYPRVPDPMGESLGMKFYSRVQVRVQNFTCGSSMGKTSYPSVPNAEAKLALDLPWCTP